MNAIKINGVLVLLAACILVTTTGAPVGALIQFFHPKGEIVRQVGHPRYATPQEIMSYKPVPGEKGTGRTPEQITELLRTAKVPRKEGIK